MTTGSIQCMLRCSWLSPTYQKVNLGCEEDMGVVHGACSGDEETLCTMFETYWLEAIPHPQYSGREPDWMVYDN